MSDVEIHEIDQSMQPPDPGRSGNWSKDELDLLIECWLADVPKKEILSKLPERTYRSIAMKAFRLGLPTRKARKELPATSNILRIMEAEDRLQPGYRFLDHDYTPEEVEKAYAAAPSQTMFADYCRNCRISVIFTNRFQRWCDECREAISKL